MLDPAGYGAVTITKAISIQGHGYSGISVASGATGITINAGFGDKIALRGLLLDGAGVGSTGIAFNTALSLTVEDCVVRNVNSHGLAFIGNATTTQLLAVSNSYFADNGGSGIAIQTGNSGTLTVSVDGTRLYGNGAGLSAEGGFGTGGLFVAVTDSVAANNTTAGFAAETTPGHSVVNLSLTHSLAEGNRQGLSVASNATIWLAQSTLTGNAFSFEIFPGGVIETYLDNYITANGAPVGSLTSVSKQ